MCKEKDKEKDKEFLIRKIKLKIKWKSLHALVLKRTIKVHRPITPKKAGRQALPNFLQRIQKP